MILEQVFRELRFEFRVRRRADINKVLDAVRLERRQELIQRARAVANREKRLPAALARRRRRPLLVTAIHDSSVSRLDGLGRYCRPCQVLRPGRPLIHQAKPMRSPCEAQANNTLLTRCLHATTRLGAGSQCRGWRGLRASLIEWGTAGRRKRTHKSRPGWINRADSAEEPPVFEDE